MSEIMLVTRFEKRRWRGTRHRSDCGVLFRALQPSLTGQSWVHLASEEEELRHHVSVWTNHVCLKQSDLARGAESQEGSGE